MRGNASSRPRVGVSLAKRHFKLATGRNRLRRIAKELFRTEINPRASGYDFVVASRPSRFRSTPGEAAKELKQLILRLKK